MLHGLLFLTGTEVNGRIQETLKKAWEVLEPNAEKHGLELFRLAYQYISSTIQIKYWH